MAYQQVATRSLAKFDCIGQILRVNINQMGKAELFKANRLSGKSAFENTFEVSFCPLVFLLTRQIDFDIKILFSISRKKKDFSCWAKLGSGLNQAGSDYGLIFKPMQYKNCFTSFRGMEGSNYDHAESFS